MATKSVAQPAIANKFDASVASEENIEDALQRVLVTLGAEGAVHYLQGQVLYYTFLAPVANDPQRTAMKARWYADQLASYFEA